MSVFLSDLQQPHIIREVAGASPWTSPEKFSALPEVAELGWPSEVVRQWLYEHLLWGEFLTDYAALDLSTVAWSLQDVHATAFLSMTSGSSDDYLTEFSKNPDYYRERFTVQRPATREAWEQQGTWLVPPLLLDLACLDGAEGVLQVVEGRTRVGILQGRVRDGLYVAGQHAAWVGRRVQ